MMVIQCNATNLHGRVLANGYINVFGRLCMLCSFAKDVFVLGYLLILLGPIAPLRFSIDLNQMAAMNWFMAIERRQHPM